MPFEVRCKACNHALKIPDEIYDRRVRGRLAILACKRCKAPIEIDGREAGQAEGKPAEAEAKPPEAEAKPAEADAKPAEADAKPPEAEAKPAEQDAKPAEPALKPAAKSA